MKKLIIGTVLMLLSISTYAQWQGTYSTSFGEVRLVQLNDKVYGDYKDVGSIKGTVKNGGRLIGTFTNGKKKGNFIWVRYGNIFTGEWAWGTSTPSGKWDGTHKSKTRPKLTSATDGKPKSSTSTAKSWVGTWNSSYGELRLLEKDGKVYGDYKNVGYIEANRKGNTIEGIYTNGSGRGFIKFTRTGNTFKGKWGDRKNQNMSDPNYLDKHWNGSIKSPAKPIVKNAIKNKIESYAGRYRITVTRISCFLDDDKLSIDRGELYGTIGVRLKGKGRSSNVEIKAMNGKKPRIWDVSASNPINVFRYPKDIDVMREFIVQGELANKNLMVNIQAKLSDADVLSDDSFPWKQRNLYVKDMVFGKEYKLICTKGEQKIIIGYMLDKI